MIYKLDCLIPVGKTLGNFKFWVAAKTTIPQEKTDPFKNLGLTQNLNCPHPPTPSPRTGEEE